MMMQPRMNLSYRRTGNVLRVNLHINHTTTARPRGAREGMMCEDQR